MKNILKTALVTSTLLTMTLSSLPVVANSTTASLRGSGTAIADVVSDGLSIISASAFLTVMSVADASDGIIVVLKDMSTGADMSLKVTGDSLQALSRFTGETLEPVVTSAGTILKTSTEEVVMFLPKAGAAFLFFATTYGG